MKAKKVLEILRISRSTLYQLRKRKVIKCKQLANGHYEYDDKSIYDYLTKELGREEKRKTVIYARVSTNKQKKDLQNQMELLKQFCIAKGWQVEGVYKDVASALNFDKREDFNSLISEILKYRIEKVVITFKDRLTRTGYEFFDNLFKSHGVELVVINDYSKGKTDIDELMEEIFTLLHSFSMKFYSQRRKVKAEVEKVLKK